MTSASGSASSASGTYPTVSASTSSGGISYQGSSSAAISTPTATSTASVEYTTSTVLTTSVYTVTSCAPTITNCPVGSVTTDIITLYTTVCPVSASSTAIGQVTSTSTPYSNSTITTGPALTTSTVYTTDLITITSCSSTILHCPASLASEIIITSTKILYTTICPVGQIQSLTTTTSATSAPALSTTLISPLPLTPCATPIISTIYIPTLQNPTYTMPTATSFTVPYPNWSSSVTLYSTSTVLAKVVTTSAPAVSVSGFPKASPSANATTTKGTTVPSTPATFTGAGNRAGAASALIAGLGAVMFVLA